ncbi:MAG: peptidylprolyl isomerase [Oceanicoccus sp.]
MLNTSLKFFRDPFIQFLILGSLVFTVFSMMTDGDGSDKNITVSAMDIARLHGQWSTQYSKQPTDDQLDSIIDQHVREEILYREAKKLNLGEEDIIIRRRMVQKYLFLSESMVEIADPSEVVLSTFYTDNKQRYKIPEKLSFRHIYYRHKPKGSGDAESAANDIAASLNASAVTPSSWRQQGDAFMLQREYAAREHIQVAELFGAVFARRLAGIADEAIGTWVAPVRSAYGWHAVKLLARIPSTTPLLVNIRPQVLADYVDDKRQQANADYYQSVRNQYHIEVDSKPDFSAGESAE